MAHKQVLFRSSAREKLLRGATQLADAIRVTLGPRSKSVLIEKKWGVPIVCNDGVTISERPLFGIRALSRPIPLSNVQAGPACTLEKMIRSLLPPARKNT
jgi:hypothetical protein